MVDVAAAVGCLSIAGKGLMAKRFVTREKMDPAGLPAHRHYFIQLSNQKATSVDQIASQWGAITRFGKWASHAAR